MKKVLSLGLVLLLVSSLSFASDNSSPPAVDYNDIVIIENDINPIFDSIKVAVIDIIPEFSADIESAVKETYVGDLIVFATYERGNGPNELINPYNIVTTNDRYYVDLEYNNYIEKEDPYPVANDKVYNRSNSETIEVALIQRE